MSDITMPESDAPREDAEMAMTQPGEEAPPGEKREMSSQDVFERLQRGETIHDAVVKNLRFKGEYDFPIRFINCTLIKPNFDRVTFKDNVTFRSCTLDRMSFNRKSVCEQMFDVGCCTLNRPLIRSLTVRGKANFANIRVVGKTAIQNCRFEGVFFAWEACFEGWVDFKQVHFVDEADLRSISCREGMSFLGQCKIEKSLLMRGASIQKKLDLGDARVEGCLDLAKAKLHDFVYLENISQGEGMQFAIWNALADRVRIRPEQLQGRLASEQRGDCLTAMQEYGLLKRSYQNLHLYDAEDWAFYRFKVNQRRSVGRTWKRPWTKALQVSDWLLLDLGCAYGTNPIRAVWAAGVIVLMFAFVYAGGAEAFHSRPPQTFDSFPENGWANRLMFGLLTSLSVFTSGLSGLGDGAKGWMNLPLVVESVLGTLLFGLFIVAFSRKVIR